MSDAAISELEAAARIFMESPNLVTQQQRQSAESLIMTFRKTKSPYSLCQQILEKSQVDLLLFEAADVLKHSLIYEWDILQDQDKLSLRQYLINYVLQRNLQSYVREKILQVIAIMIKRFSILDSGRERTSILDEMQKMISSGDIQQQFLACRFVYSIMQEYVTTIKSDDTGLTFEEHFKAKKQFELVDLKKIFVMILNAFEEMMKIVDLSNPTHAHLLLEFYTIQEQILLWGYVSPLLPKRLIGVFETTNKTEQSPSLRLNMQWERIMMDPKVIELFFSIYWKVRELPQLQQKALTCIVQLSTLNGPIISATGNRLKYVTSYLTHFLQLMSSIQVKSTEAIGIATIIRKITIYNPPNTLKELTEEIRRSLLQQMFLLTCNFAENSVREEDVCFEESVYMDALDKILEAWLLIIQGKEYFPTDLLTQYSIELFNKYLQCHLSPPDGLRGMFPSANANSTIRENEEEIDENDEKNNQDRVKEQLIIIGTLGRESPGHSLPILCKLLEDKTRRLHGQLQRIYTNSQNLNTNDDQPSQILNTLFEDILWILLISGHVLSMEAVGEHPIIPAEIMQHSMMQNNNGVTDITTSLKVLASPSQCITEFPNAENSSDHVIRLVAAVFRLCEIENKAIEVNMKSVLSPEVTRYIMWFLQMWSESYLLPLSEYYYEMSESLKTAFGLDTPGGNWTIGFLLNKVCVNVQNFYAEKEVVNESIQLFVSLVKRRQKCPAVFNSEHFKQIVQLRNLDIPKMALMKGLTITASCISDKDIQLQYLNEMLMPIRINFDKIEWQQIMDNSANIGPVSVQIAFILDEIRACQTGVTSETAQKIYEFFEPVLINLGNVVNIFHSFQIVVVATLELLCEVVQNLIFIGEHKVYKVCEDVIRAYVKHNTNRVSLEATAEEDSLEDLLLLLKLMNHLLSKTFFGVLGPVENPMDQDECCVFGFQQIMPLITMDMLKYPTLCMKYYQAITFFVDAKAHKVCILSPDLISNILRSIEMGLHSFGAEIQGICFNFLQVFATFIYFDQNPQSFSYTALMHFLKMIIEMILTQEVGSDNKNECAKALFSLICCYKDNYVQIVHQIIQTQSNPDHIERLSKEFSELTTNINLVNNRVSQIIFLDKFDKFIVNISFLYS